jgi:hypothetical protein
MYAVCIPTCFAGAIFVVDAVADVDDPLRILLRLDPSRRPEGYSFVGLLSRARLYRASSVLARWGVGRCHR